MTVVSMHLKISPEALGELLSIRADEARSQGRREDELALRIVAEPQGATFSYDLAFERRWSLPLRDEIEEHKLDSEVLAVALEALTAQRMHGAELTVDAAGTLVVKNKNTPKARTPKGLIGDDELAGRIDAVLAASVNPDLAAHGGAVRLLGHRDAVVWLEMLGGCQGCSLSHSTMTKGVAETLIAAIPEIVEVRDGTDHSLGSNPWMK
jgi:Fe/S biogenesis protein NfuA